MKKTNPISKLKDGRYTKYRENFYKWLAIFLLAFILSAAILGFSFRSAKKDEELLSPRGSAFTPTITPKPTSNPESSPLSYIRWKGQQEGFDDYTISRFIAVARNESGFDLDPHAKNPYSTAKGVFQFIDSTWRHYCLEDGNVYNYVDNINCFYKVLREDGYPKGLSHWSESLEVAGLEIKKEIYE